MRWLVLSHLHIDHLIGFDHLLRVRLFSDLPLMVFGPPGTTEVIGHRLKGYSWNLTSGSPFWVETIDLSSPLAPIVGATYRCEEQFDREELDSSVLFSGERTLTLREDLSLSWYPVDHGVPCYCYLLRKNLLAKFSQEMCIRLGLKPGSWVQKLLDSSDEDFGLEVEGEWRNREWLSERLLSHRDDEMIGYLTDTRLVEPLFQNLSKFFYKVDILACETAYLASEERLADKNLHMTTHQGANLARCCGAKELHLFHLSRRYQESGSERHLEEARSIFPQARLLKA